MLTTLVDPGKLYIYIYIYFFLARDDKSQGYSNPNAMTVQKWVKHRLGDGPETKRKRGEMYEESEGFEE